MPVPAQKISEPTVSLSSIDSFLPGIKNRSSALVRNPRVKQQMVILAMYYWKQSLTSTDTLYSSKLMQGIDSKIEASNSL